MSFQIGGVKGWEIKVLTRNFLQQGSCRASALRFQIPHEKSQKSKPQVMRLAAITRPRLLSIPIDASKGVDTARALYFGGISKSQDRRSASLERQDRSLTSMSYSGYHYEVFGKVSLLSKLSSSKVLQAASETLINKYKKRKANTE